MIDSRAIIDPSAKISAGVTIEPFAVIGADVEIGEGSCVCSHAVVKGPTRIGKNNKIYSFSSVGEAPQDKKYAGEETWLEIGDDNVIREFCTINRGTVQCGGVTRIGNNNWIMAYVHIAHDCILGNNTVLANNATLAGHVTIGDYVILGGATLIHQFCSVGAYAFTAMGSVVPKDIPPYLMVSGHMAKSHGLNTEGLKRNGFTHEEIKLLRSAYKTLFRSGLTKKESIAQLQPLAKKSEPLKVLVDFIENSKRGVIR